MVIAVEFRDAGKKIEYPTEAIGTVASDKKYYPSLEIDLFKFPELSKDIGEECKFIVKGVVTRKSLSEGEKCQYMEIRSIGVGESDSEENQDSKNEADIALDKLASPKTY